MTGDPFRRTLNRKVPVVPVLPLTLSHKQKHSESQNPEKNFHAAAA
jgi:hypothetical protein